MLKFHHSVLLSIAASFVWFNVRSESESGIRLVGGPDTVPNAGRVEVWSHDVSRWIAVCDSEWDFKDAQVVCRELGFTGTGQVKQGSYFGDGSIINSSVVQYDCFGTEPSLSRCPSKTVAEACPSGQTAGVICTAPGYVGCYRDHTGEPRDTFLHQIARDNMTIEMCLRQRSTDSTRNGSTPLYAGLENGDECWYDLENVNFVVRKRDDSLCGIRCTGDSDQTCGSPNARNSRISIYDVTLSYCVDPGMVPNGTRAIRYAVDEFYFGTIIIVTCDSGFHLQGAPSIQCLMSQPYGVAWNASLPECLDLSTTSEAPVKTVLPSIMPTKMELCQSNTGTYVGIGGAFTVSIITAAVLIAVCYDKRRGADKSNTNQSPRATANTETGVKLHAPRNKYEEQGTTSHNNESYGYAMDTIAGEDGETKSAYATIPDDVTKRQSGGVVWEDNTLYETSCPTDPEYLEVG